MEGLSKYYSKKETEIKIRQAVYDMQEHVTTVGTLLECPFCLSNFEKECSQQRFCSSACEERYWKEVDP